MGRKTFESIGRVLPNRRTIVVSRNPAYRAPGCETASSVEAALALADREEEIFIAGGEAIYRAALPYTDRIYLTEIELLVDGDTSFPEFSTEEFQESERGLVSGETPYSYVTYSRLTRHVEPDNRLSVRAGAPVDENDFGAMKVPKPLG